jgi:GAF domain-containing protein
MRHARQISAVLSTHRREAQNIEDVAFAEHLDQNVRWEVDKQRGVALHSITLKCLAQVLGRGDAVGASSRS